MEKVAIQVKKALNEGSNYYMLEFERIIDDICGGEIDLSYLKLFANGEHVTYVKYNPFKEEQYEWFINKPTRKNDAKKLILDDETEYKLIKQIVDEWHNSND